MSAPVLILGVHRSGTSVLSRVVQDLGIHMGYRQDSNAESAFFQRINRRLDSECGGHWTTPTVVYECARAAAKDPTLCAPLKAYVTGPAAYEYWGPSLILRRKESLSWGWKDPRTAHLLPIWNTIYPDARIIWIERHPAAASLSLAHRTRRIRTQIASLAGNTESNARADHAKSLVSLAKRLYRGQPVLSDALRINDVDDALELVLEYAELHRDVIPDWSGPDLLRLKYEDLVTAKEETVSKVAAFLDVSNDHPGYRTAVNRLTAQSRDSYLDDPEVMSAIARRRDRIAALGFDS